MMAAALCGLVFGGCEGDLGSKPTKVETTSEEASLAQKVFQLVNVERNNAGLTQLLADQALDDVAWLHSKDMVERGYFEHVSPDGLDHADRAKEAGVAYSEIAENIAQGHTAAESVVEGWMNSDVHRANILNEAYTHLGVGVVLVDGKADDNKWTQVFLKP